MKDNYPDQKSRRSFLLSSSLLAAASLFKTEHVSAASKYFQPDIDEEGLTIVFHGDSITDGARGRGLDPNHIMGHGYVFSIVSRVGADFPDRKLKFYNRGIGSTKLSDTKKRWQTDALDLNPDILSILIGVNDSMAYVANPDQGEHFDQFEADYREILTAAKQQNPNIIFVLGLPFIFPVGKTKDNWELWHKNMEKRQTLIRKLAIEFGTILLDYPAAIEKACLRAPIDYWIWDGIHPTVPGHELLTREWLKQVSARVKFLKYYQYR